MAPTDEAVFATLPGVPITRDNIEHYRGLLERRLLLNRCLDCGYWIYPHRPLCPECLSWNVGATEVSGKARVFMFTLIHQERNPQDRLQAPLPVAAIELNEQPGLRYLATIVNCPHDQIAIDMPIRLVWIDRDDFAWPAFEPAPGR
jgi:uncharacterized protein